MSTDALFIKDELIGAFPTGEDDPPIDWRDPEGPGPLMEGIALLLKNRGADQVDILRDQLCPLTAGDPGSIPEWERALGVDQSRRALARTIGPRKDQVVSRLREYGPPTVGQIQSVLSAYLDQAPGTIDVIQTSREALREIHTYHWTGSQSVAGPTSFVWTVYDDAVVSDAGVQVDLSITGDISQLRAVLGNQTEVRVLSDIGRHTATSPRTFASFALQQNTIWTGVWVWSKDDVWAIAQGGVIAHWDGSAWSLVTSPIATNLNAIWFSSQTHGWIVGDGGKTLRWNGTTWTDFATGIAEDLYCVWGTDSATVFVGGASGRILEWNGAGWNNTTLGAGSHRGLWGSAADKVWLVGDSGSAWYFDGAWADLSGSMPTGANLNGIWGSHEGDIFAVGSGGAAVHYDQADTWSVMSTGIADALFAVWGTGAVHEHDPRRNAREVWAVGANGAMLLWTGTEWLSWTSPLASPYYALHGAADGTVLAIGDDTDGARMLIPTDGTGKVRLYFPSIKGSVVAGAWSIQLYMFAGSATVTDAELFVEGQGRDARGDDGLGAQIWSWAVVADPNKFGAGADLGEAYAAVQRLTYARSNGYLVRRSATALAAIPDDPAAIPDMAVTG